MGGAGESLHTLRASAGSLRVVFSPASSRPGGARSGRAAGMREERTAAPLPPAWEEPAGVSGGRGPLPTSTTRGQQSVVAAARVEEGAGEGEGPLGAAGRMPVRFLIKFLLDPRV